MDGALLQHLWDASPDGLCVLAGDRITEVNSTLCRMLGRGAQDLIGTELLSWWLGADTAAPLVELPSVATLVRPAQVNDATPSATPPAAPSARAPLVASLTCTAQGPGRSVIRLRDVTEQQALASELAAAHAALEESLNGYDVVDATGHFVYVNRAYLKMWGYDSPGEVLGTTPHSHCADPDVPRRLIEAVMRDGSATMEFEAVRKDGSTFDVLMNVQRTVTPSGESRFVGTSLDVSEIKALRASLIEAQRLEAVGRLAAGVAHDFNNVLVPIVGYTDLLLGDASLGPEQLESLSQIQLAAAGAREVTSQLLSLARPQSRDRGPVDLVETLSTLRGLLSRLLRENIQLALDLPPRPVVVHADAGQLQRVLMNLITNASDAMPSGGHLEVSLGTTADGSSAELRIVDTGVGIPESQREQVFQAFYSTKGSRGTGLGLVSVANIVRAHGGSVELASEVGRGTTFRIRLPLSERTVEVPSVPPPSSREALQGYTVLVAEDNDLVRRVTERILRKEGLSVVTARTGGEVSTWLQQDDAALDLLLTDVVLGDVEGRALADSVRAARPQARVLFMSGYAEESQQARFDSDVPLLEKPFSPEDLVRRVHQVLRRD